jgi:hypothetical protein
VTYIHGNLRLKRQSPACAGLCVVALELHPEPRRPSKASAAG